MEMLRKVLKDKEDEISKLKKQIRQAKEDTIQEYRDSNALKKELDESFADGFDDCFRQVKTSFSDLDLSYISINAQAQTPTRLANSEGIDELFADDTTTNP